jgi:hypothetical protein
MLTHFRKKIFGDRHLCFGQLPNISWMGTLTNGFEFRIFAWGSLGV